MATPFEDSALLLLLTRDALTTSVEVAQHNAMGYYITDQTPYMVTDQGVNFYVPMNDGDDATLELAVQITWDLMKDPDAYIMEQKRLAKERHEAALEQQQKYERDTYERLRAKFEGGGTSA